MSDSIEGKPVLRRSDWVAREKQRELERQQAEKLQERRQASHAAVQAGSSKRQPSAVETNLKLIGVVSVASGMIGGAGLMSGGRTPEGMALLISGIVSAIGLFWMAQVLGTLLEIRDLLDR